MTEAAKAMEPILLQSEVGFQRIAREEQRVRWAEESQFALQAVTRSARLQGCRPESIQDAIINVAAVGLTLNPAHGYAYLIPEWDRDAEANLCQLRVSFKGLLKLAGDSGVAKWVRADVVKKNDDFVYNGAWELPTHSIPDPFGDRGKSVGVYCTIKTHDGEYLTELAPWSEVLKAKAAAKTKNVWDQWEDEMAKKFIIKRASKQWPKVPGVEHLERAISVINQTEGSDSLEQNDEIAAGILEILHGEYEDDVRAEMIHEQWHPLSEDQKRVLWTAVTKGGYFTQAEKTRIRELGTLYYENAKASGAEDE